MATEFGDIEDVFPYLKVDPTKGGFWHLFKYGLWGDLGSGLRPFLESSDEVLLNEAAADHRWVILVSIIMRKLIVFFGKPLEWTGFVVDFILNLLSLNGDFFGLLFNLVRGNVTVPHRGSETFISTIGHLDGRIDLYRCDNLLEDGGDTISQEITMKAGLSNQALMDLCMMASKLAYENEKVVRNVVTLHWKMHFVDFYNCWNDYQKESSTQVFILCDKPKDASLIVISFRGTEPFDADDWCTDFDYSWYEIPELGKVHMGFLEALGLGNRTNTITFQQNLKLGETRTVIHSNGVNVSKIPSEHTDGSDGHIVEEIEPVMSDMTAYFLVRSRLKSLLEEHKNAKFVVTGHSLGGALAILFPTVLVFHEEKELLLKMLGVYTFGQPRVGDSRLRQQMEAHLDFPIPRYFRIVYCNDLVPRLPYDDNNFLYKHFGVCLYYDSMYNERKMDEEPNRNFYGLRYLIPERLNAVWELVRGLAMGYAYGPAYKEGWFSILFRIVGLALPGISAHSPINYINSLRLGKECST